MLEKADDKQYSRFNRPPACVPGTNPHSSRLTDLEIKKQEGYEELNRLQRTSSQKAAMAIQLSASMGFINPHNIKNMVDFGAGYGGPTYALAQIGRCLGAEVEALEIEKHRVQGLVNSGILPEHRVHLGDGIAYLLDKAGEYDLITSFMLGPDPKGSLFQKLAKASREALTESGRLLITSDSGTLSRIEEICKKSGVDYNRIQGVTNAGRFSVPTTLIFSRSSCGKIGKTQLPEVQSFSIDAITEQIGKLPSRTFSHRYINTPGFTASQTMKFKLLVKKKAQMSNLAQRSLS